MCDAYMTSPLFVPGTNSAAGLDATTDMIKQQGRHDDGVPVVVIFLTDGHSNNPTKTELAAKDLHTTLPEVKVSPIRGNVLRYYLRRVADYGVAQKTGPAYLIANILKTP